MSVMLLLVFMTVMCHDVNNADVDFHVSDALNGLHVYDVLVYQVFMLFMSMMFWISMMFLMVSMSFVVSMLMMF